MADRDEFQQKLSAFPRHPVSFKLTRRQLFTQFVREWAVLEDAEQGKPVYRLADLGSVSDEGLAALTPQIVPACHISVVGDEVRGQLPEDAEPRLLFDRQRELTFVFNAINGRTTLDDISSNLAAYMGWDKLQAFALVRGLFLHLVQMKVCQPT